MSAKDIGTALMNKLFKEYRINVIYAADDPSNLDHAKSLHKGFTPIQPSHLAIMEKSQTANMHSGASYGRDGLKGFALIEQGIPVCAAHFATPDQYDRAGTWPLKQGQIALMDISTEEKERGRGLAAQLLTLTTAYFLANGEEQVIAFIWWSNAPSIRAFTKAGWRKIGYSAEFLFGKKWRKVHIKSR